jgi:hypothetical protein
MAESKLRTLADELEGLEDEISEVTEQHIHLPAGFKGEIDADATGRLRAVSHPDVETTKPDNARPESEAPPSKQNLLALAWLGIRRMPPWGITLVFLAAIAAYAVLNR